jgi:cell fate regulator YaaT (PSP1 superfamily)
MGRGCLFCGGGDQIEATICEGCFKLHETDWLADYPTGALTDIFEVRFKNTRKSYYKNIHNLPLKKGDIVAVEASPGHDIGIISLTGDMVARQMKRVGFTPFNGEFKAIYRKAKPYDIEKWQEAIALEHETMIRSRQIAKELQLDMKIGDVEYQGDRIKAIFYYIADGRVDFRELIKVFASEFGIKVEMKQIGARQEAGRIGGLGSCGRELCCASWIASFNSITTGAARTQDISLNPQKLAGQCCKLKCCLVYELDAYIDARKSMPRVNEPLRADDGDYYLISSDILRHTMSFSTSQGASQGNVTLPVAKVREVIEMNRKGKKPESLLNMVVYKPKEVEPAFVDAVGEESITRFDTARRKNKGRNNRGRGEASNGQNVNNRQIGYKQGPGNGQQKQNRPNENNRQGEENRQNRQNEGNRHGEGGYRNHNRGRNNRNRPPKTKTE